MEPFTELAVRLETAQDFQGLLSEAGQQESGPLLVSLNELLRSSHMRAGFVVAKALAARGVTNPVPYLLIAAGGFLFGLPGEEENGKVALATLADLLGPHDHKLFYESALCPVVLKLLEDPATITDHLRTLRILELLKAGDPPLRQVFDRTLEEAVAIGPDLPAPRREVGKLLHFASPPAGSPRVPRRVVVAIRELMFPLEPNSRALEHGPRMTAAMNAYGWQASHFKMKCTPMQNDYDAILELCRGEAPDLLILDDYWVFAEGIRPGRAEMIARLRQEVPGLKIMGLHLDSWAIDEETLIETGSQLDAIWDPACQRTALWRHPRLAGKVTCASLPYGCTLHQPSAPLPPKLLFSGSLRNFNWHRFFWRAAAEFHHLPIDWQIARHVDDGLDALDSFDLYMRRIAQYGSCINFAMRSDHSRIVTGRSFDTILAGALLVEEATPDLDNYFTPGEHYLEFTSFSDLRAIAAFIAAKPEEAEEIRRRGSAFGLERYSDEKVVGYLEAHLYHSRP